MKQDEDEDEVDQDSDDEGEAGLAVEGTSSEVAAGQTMKMETTTKAKGRACRGWTSKEDWKTCSRIMVTMTMRMGMRLTTKTMTKAMKRKKKKKKRKQERK
jgi:hypothetical protein